MSAGGIVPKAVHCEPLGYVNGVELQGTKVEVLKRLQRKIQRELEMRMFTVLSAFKHHTTIPTSPPTFLFLVFILNNDPREEGWGWSEKEQPVLPSH